MTKWLCKGCASAAAAMLLAAGPVPGVEAQDADRAAALLEKAGRAAGAFDVDVAVSHLHELVFEHPRSPEAPAARLQLARLLALADDLPAALLQCQLVRDGVPADRAEWQEATDLARTLMRRWREASATPYARSEPIGPAALSDMNSPAVVLLEPDGGIVIVDSSRRRFFRTGGDQAPLPQASDPITATLQPDGRVLAVTRNASLVSVDGPPRTLSATVRGRAQALRRIESIAVSANGDLLVADREADSLLRCAAGSNQCAPWGPTGRVRLVKVDRSGLVYTIDDRQASVRIVDPAGRQLATFGATTPGVARVGRLADLDVDRAYGLYVLDSDQRQVHVIYLAGGPDGRLLARPQRPVVIRSDGPDGLRNPSAVAVTSDGGLIVAGRGGAIRYR